MVSPWELVLKDEPLRFGFRKLQRHIFRVPDGSEQEFYLKAEGVCTSVAALTKDGQVILARQYRPGPDRVLHELPGGMVAGDEDPRVAAERELLEETGYRAGRVEVLGSYPRCAYSTGVNFAFMAFDCERVANPELDPVEFVETVLVSPSEFASLIQQGQMTDMPAALFALRRLEALGLLV